MPLRGLIYFGREYDDWLRRANLSHRIFGKKLVKIPAPEYYVLYNGTEDMPERITYKLSDAFRYPKEGYEWTAHAININAGHNRELMEKCEPLKGYAEIISLIRNNQRKGMVLEQAVDAALETCIQNNVLKDYLLRSRSEVRQMIFSRWTDEEYRDFCREEGLEEGFERGIEQGLQRGQEDGMRTLSALIQKLISENRIDEISRVTSDQEYRDSLLRTMMTISDQQ